MTEAQEDKKEWLHYANLSDAYERKARFLPGLLSVITLLPVSFSFGGPLFGWLQALLVGTGLGAVISIGISHLSSAAGNRIQAKIWPQWPHDSPTNLWLHPDDTCRSQQQKEILYAAIKRLTGLDIPAARRQGDSETKAVINDAVSTIRYRLRNSKHADRLRIHNIDYGFARNFAGLSPFWLSFSVFSCFGCWLSNFYFQGSILWGILSSFLFVLFISLDFFVLKKYVEQKANQYAESFMGSLIELDRFGP